MKQLDKSEMNALFGGIGKRQKTFGKVYSIKVSPLKSSKNPLAGISGFPDSLTPEVEIDAIPPTSIREVKVDTTQESAENKDWYDLQGRRIEKPTKAGIYIQNRKKVVIK